MIIHPKNTEEFVNEIKSGSTLVDFYATWCGPCRMLAPIIEELDEENILQAKILKVDVDQLDEVAAQYGIQSIPTLILFKDGNPIKKAIGYQGKESLIEFVNK